jgi:magnesium transporter
VIRSYRARNGQIEPVQIGHPDSADAIIWIDLYDPTREEELAVETLIGVGVPTKQEMAEIEESARLYQEGGSVVMTAVVIDGVAEGRPRRAQVTFLLKPGLLVTVRYANPMSFRTFQAKCERQPDAHDTVPQLFVSLLETIVERSADVLEIVAADLSEVSLAIFFGEGKRGPDSEGLQSLLIKLGRKNLIISIVRESMFSLGRLVPFAREAAPQIKEGTNGRLKSLERDVKSLVTYEAQLSTEIGFLQDSTLGLINIRQNAIIKVFSIAAVLFLPPTLVGTVYGMNFATMPELDWIFGYPMALGLMVVSAIIPLWWFKRRGWL